MPIEIADERVCEKLLGWKRGGERDGCGQLWRVPAAGTRREEYWYTPEISSWTLAGKIVEAFDAAGYAHTLMRTHRSHPYECRIYVDTRKEIPDGVLVTTRMFRGTGADAPSAIHAAALKYLKETE